MKPNRSRSGAGSSPARVVAPTRVNFGSSRGIAVAPGPLADDDVDAEVLHRDVEHLLGRPRHPVDLVEEEHLPLVEGTEDGREVPRVLDRRTAGLAQGGAHLGGDDHRQRRLPQTGRTGEEDVVARRLPRLGRVQDQRELLAHDLLPDELVEAVRAQGRLGARSRSSAPVVTSRSLIRGPTGAAGPRAAHRGRRSRPPRRPGRRPPRLPPASAGSRARRAPRRPGPCGGRRRP